MKPIEKISDQMKTKTSTIILFVGIATIPFDFVLRVGVARVTIAEFILSFAFIFWLFDVMRSRERIILAPFAMPFLFFLGACVVSLINAQDRMVTLREVVQFAWLFSIFFFVAHECKEGSTSLKIWWLLLSVAIVVSIVGVYQYFFARDPVHFQVAGARLRAHGFYDQPNTLGSFLIGIIPLIFGSYFLSSNISGDATGSIGKMKRFFSNKKMILIFFFVISAGLITTFSRGSWLGLVCGVVIFAYLLKGKKFWKRFAVLLGVIGVTAVLVLVDVSEQPKVVERAFSNRQRTLLIISAMSMIRDHPIIGLGFGNFPTRLEEYASPELLELMHQDFDETTKKWFVNQNKAPDVELVHNMFLQVTVETGILGLIGFLWILIVYYREALKRFRDSLSDQGYYIRAAMIASVTAILISGIFGWPFSHGVQELLIIAMAIAIAP
jgi:putative inorganic carbon (hco3(-)) transporter